jgi:glycosyltransferase involved in cell wall biosynthesis
VNNNCTDNTLNLVKSLSKQFQSIRIIFENNQGIGSARESGFRNSEARIIASSDADLIVPHDWIVNIFGEFWENKNLSGLVGTYIFDSKSKAYNLASKLIMTLADYFHKIITYSFVFR